MKVLEKLNNDGGRSLEQGNFWNPRDIARETIPMHGSVTKTPSLVEAHFPNLSTLVAVLRGNSRGSVGKQTFSVFPTSASQANNPQTVKRGK
jgi:hypothetical protein